MRVVRSPAWCDSTRRSAGDNLGPGGDRTSGYGQVQATRRLCRGMKHSTPGSSG